MAEVSRRDVLKLGVFGGAVLALPLERSGHAQTGGTGRLATSRLPKPFIVPFAAPPVLAPVRTDATTDFYRVKMRPALATIIPGFRTPIWGYDGIYPGPTVRAVAGRKTVMRQINSLPDTAPGLSFTPWTSVHLHGMPSQPQFDGYASDITNPGQYKDYLYPNSHTASTLWYHDHGVHHTTETVGMGLAAQYHLHDKLELSLPIPRAEFDIPLIVGDVMFKPDGSILFDDHDESGVFGDVILVNGRPWPAMPVKRRKYRFRMLNASITRSYNVFLDSGAPFDVIGTDGGLMPHPTRVATFRFAPAERYEVVIDFSRYPVGRRVVLGNRSPKNNIDFVNTDKLMAFDVVADDFDLTDNTVPDTLNPDNATMALQPSQAVATRHIALVRENGLWTINGHTWQDVIDSGFTLVEASPRSGDVEIWEFKNESGGWHHPMHVHLIDFKILSRNGRPPFPYEVGPKDVVYLGEGETVRVITRIDQGTGKYMMHCHNLVHEDHDMMSQFEVVGAGETDPLSDRALDLPEQTTL
jgi:FtsP/CotA-like multicopper oxidase with cupredoxin domain